MKAKGLPSSFPVRDLSRFDFGNSDAFLDDHLFNFFCCTDFVESTRRSSKTIIVGPRGSGKSAIYKAYKQGRLHPEELDGQKFRFIGVDQELKYLDTDGIIKGKFSVYGYTDEFKYALLWEFYIVFRLLLDIQQHLYSHLSEDMRMLATFFANVDIPENSNLTIFLDRLKNIKFSASVSDGTFVYTSSLDLSKAKETENKFDLSRIKSEMNQILRSNGIVTWVLIDRIDDFLVREEYDVQRKLLQGLVIAENSFADLSNIFIKVFLRADLYDKADFSFAGYDKIGDKVVKIKWKPQEIRRFIAQRVLWNLFRVLSLRSIRFELEDDELNFSETDVTDLQEDQGGILRKLFSDERQGRKTSLNDQISKKIITSIFPTTVHHYTDARKQKEIGVFEFMETHMRLSFDEPTPRILLQFLNLCIEKTRSYFSNNPDQTVMIDKNKEYPLIKRTCIQEAYGDLSRQAWDHIINYDKKWKYCIQKFFESRGSKTVFDYGFFSSLLQIDRDQIRQLLAFLEHIGCLRRKDSKIGELESRKYDLPVLLRAVDFFG